jgi:hypothetical protein
MTSSSLRILRTLQLCINTPTQNVCIANKIPNAPADGAQALINYIKLFTLMWFTWLSVTLFDVRFSIDCVWNRFHKAIQFGIFTGFVYAGPVFDKYSTSGVEKSYRNFAIVLVIGRIAIAVQYAVVMWQGRMFRQTLIPLGLSAGVHAAASIGYAVTMVAFPKGRVGLEEQVAW